MTGSGDRVLILNDNLGVGIFFGNWQRLRFEKFYMLFHSPPGLIQTIFEAMADAGEAF
ncbi:MAG: hypothetical protein OEN50_06355 [Deltaproteobacteria bacterium]|nr:hypothetical protein [Deltaproteobacteria bacterium]